MTIRIGGGDCLECGQRYHDTENLEAELTRLREENKDFSELLWSVVHSDMAMREEDEGNKARLLSSIREALAKHSKGSE